MESTLSDTLQSLLTSETPADVREGLERIRKLMAGAPAAEVRRLAEMASGLFYIDVLDHPEMVPVVDDAIQIVAGTGAEAIPLLLDILDAADMKAQIACGHALGRIGTAAIIPLLVEYESSAPTRRALILFALGKVRTPEIVSAVPIAIEASVSPDAELCDTATRALGKLAEAIPAGAMTEPLRRAAFERLHAHVSSPNPSLRAKAIRSLGKMAKFGHLTEPERRIVARICSAALGIDDEQSWDRAYIVRKEAEQALRAASV